MSLDEFNTADIGTARAAAAVWAAIPTWVEAVVAGRPYADIDSLARHADQLAHRWTRADLATALAHHPRIGRRADGSDPAAQSSRREQASMATASDGLAAAMARANAAYEERFGQIFLIRAAGRTPEEMLAEARRRLGNDDEAEVVEALDQLRQIALLRLRTDLEDAG